MSARAIVAYDNIGVDMQRFTNGQIVNMVHLVVLQKEVARNLDKGWQPFGPIVATQYHVYQTIVKYAEEKAAEGR